MKSIICLLVFTIALFPSYARAKSSKEIKSVINLYGVTFIYGIPPWISGNAETLLKESKVHRKQTGPFFIIEQISAKETFDSWTRLFGIKAVRIRKTPTIEQWMSLNLLPFQRSCAGYQAKILSKTKSAAFVQIFCPTITRNVSISPTDKRRGGEILVGRYIIVGDVLIGHYLEWRGASFDPQDEKSWPASKQEVKKGIDIIKNSLAIKR